MTTMRWPTIYLIHNLLECILCMTINSLLYFAGTRQVDNEHGMLSSGTQARRGTVYKGVVYQVTTSCRAQESWAVSGTDN